MDAAEFDGFVREAIAIDVVKYDEGAREAIRDADLVLAVDAGRRQWALFFGQDRLREIAAGNESAQLRTVTVALDSQFDDVEYLCAALEVLKGGHEYPGGFVQVSED